MRISVLMTCHNRKHKTIACLRALGSSAALADVDLEVVVVDDGSTDGTSEAVVAAFPSVKLLKGDGNLYWNRGMHWAQAAAMAAPPNFLLWLNDDTILKECAIASLIETHREVSERIGRQIIVVGATVDQADGSLTYGGAVARNRIQRFSYRKVWSRHVPVECEVMNGNVVLIPAEVAMAVGNIDVTYEHAMGDTDYALRARRAGFKLYVAPGVSGYCSSNPSLGTFKDESLPIVGRWKMFTSRKGLPPASWLHFSRMHGGAIWPLYFLYPYLFFLVRVTLQRLRRVSVASAQ